MAEPDEQRAEGTEQFQGLILSLGTAALSQLGGKQGAQARAADLEQAKQAIDLLEVLQARTTGNCTPEEERLLESILFDLRMRFLAAARGAPPGPETGAR
jgi:hypothetical protein